MKNRDQLLLEQAYEATRSLKLGQDEQGPFVPHKTSQGKVLPNRFWRFYDSKGNRLAKTTPLEEGQITYYQDINTVDYYQVKKQEDGFVGVPFKPSREVADLIMNQTNAGIEKDKDQAMNHFFGTGYSKLSDDELLETYKDFCDKRFNTVFAPGEEEENNQKLKDLYAEIKKRGSKLRHHADWYESDSREMER